MAFSRRPLPVCGEWGECFEVVAGFRVKVLGADCG